jgi:hypothetical protein
MSLDTTALTNGFGWVLTRTNTSTGDETIVDWCNGDMDESLDWPGPGTYTYAVKMVVGSAAAITGYTINSVAYGQAGYTQLAQMVVQELRR